MAATFINTETEEAFQSGAKDGTEASSVFGWAHEGDEKGRGPLRPLDNQSTEEVRWFLFLLAQQVD